MLFCQIARAHQTWRTRQRDPLTVAGYRATLSGPEESEQAITTRAVLGDLIDACLITADEEAVEITHETLPTAWPRLRQWLTEDRAVLRIHRALTRRCPRLAARGARPQPSVRRSPTGCSPGMGRILRNDLNADERAFTGAGQQLTALFGESGLS